MPPVGLLIIPAFAVGRTQERAYDLHQLAEAKEIPELPIVLHRPLASRATAVFSRNADLFDESEAFFPDTGRKARGALRVPPPSLYRKR